MDSSLVPLPVKIVPAPDLIRRYTSFDVTERLHLESLMASWSLLADLSFSDLLLFAPVTRDSGEGDEAVPEPALTSPEPGDLEPREPEPGEPALEGSALTPPEPGEPEPKESGIPGVDRLDAFVVLGQIRPTTSQTLYEVDLVGPPRACRTWSSLISPG
jgi:hypothetical protein